MQFKSRNNNLNFKGMIYAKIMPDGGLCSTALGEEEAAGAGALGLKPLAAADEKPETTGLQGVEPRYEEMPDEIRIHWRVVENHPARVKAEIARLKGELAAGDYRVVKCQECMMLGLPLPYPAEPLHGEREALRAEINRLEALLV